MTAIASQGEIEAPLGGKVRKLAFSIGDFEEVEARLGIGIGEIIRRMATAYRLTDMRVLLTIALERAGWKATAPVAGRIATEAETRQQVLDMIRVEGPGAHARTCIRLISTALEDMPGNVEAPEAGQENGSTASQSGATSSSAE